ncbi:MAG: sulfite exporter TauE/SafE family protein [Chitinophagaceae bacterium]|nr:sulfite exporter TauE/SafE family protein [Chitinophagaceae bacterium]
MHQSYSFIIIAVIGITAGFLSGMLGIGGAIIIIPCLVFILGYSQLTAQGTALAMFIMPVGILAAWQYYNRGYVDIKTALILAFFFFIGAFIGAKVVMYIPQIALKKIFAVFLIAIALKILLFDK